MRARNTDRRTDGSRHEPLAITGIGCRFPGEASDPRSFWKLLLDGVDAVSEVPPDRWSLSAFHDPEPGKPGKSYSRWGGFIRDIDLFDPQFFGISGREARFMDPQQRLLLHTAWEALEDGGHVTGGDRCRDTGVFIGISTTDYGSLQGTITERGAVSPFTAIGTVMSIAANRISYCLDFTGPSIAVDTACSSSLVAVDLACQSLWRGDCRMALAGGVNCLLLPSGFAVFSSMMALAADGRCKAFDAAADGFVRGEGAGVIVLKPLHDALADGDRIYAAVLASGTNQDGRTPGIAMPSGASQTALVRRTCAQAGIDPKAVGYVEAHGTGTAVGDPVEAAALGEAVGRSRPSGRECVIGSVKTNLGHLESASGVAGIIKTALMLRHGVIPPSLHFSTPNPAIDFAALGLRVGTAVEPFPSLEEGNGAGSLRIAGVNSFGFGGTNAHVLLASVEEEPVGAAAEPAPIQIASEGPPEKGGPQLLPLSARTEGALKGMAAAYRIFLGETGEGTGRTLSDICHAAAVRRDHHPLRLSVSAASRPEMIRKLEGCENGEVPEGCFSSPGSPPGKTAFVFCGQGPQLWAAGRMLYGKEKAFREAFDACHQALLEAGGWSLIDEFRADETRSRLQNTAYAQPMICALQIALAGLWRSWGITPAAVVGHSVGEIAAAHVAGALDLPAAMEVIYHRGRGMGTVPPGGRMLAVGLSAAEAEKLVARSGDGLSLAAVNGPSSATISGDGETLASLVPELEESGVFNRFLSVEYAFHSRHMDPVRQDMLTALEGIAPVESSLPIYSTVTGKPVAGPSLTAPYWWRNVRQTVRFAEAVNSLLADGVSTFVEIGPHPVLAASIRQCITAAGIDNKANVLPSLRHQEDEAAAMTGTLGALFCLGEEVDWQGFSGRVDTPFVPLPLYAWESASYWNESPVVRSNRLEDQAHPMLGRSLKQPEPGFETLLDSRLFPYLNDHTLGESRVFPGAAYVEMALAAAKELIGPQPVMLEEIVFQRALFLPEAEQAPTLQIRCHPGEGRFSFHSRVDADSSWTVHAAGKMRSRKGTDDLGRADMDRIGKRCKEPVGTEAMYRMMKARGLTYGPLFRPVSELRRGEGEALSTIILSEGTRLEGDTLNIHPVLLDGCFQTVFGALADEDRHQLFLPVAIERFKILPIPSTAQFMAHARLVTRGRRFLKANIKLLDGEGRVLAVIEGFRCQAVDGRSAALPGGSDGWMYEPRWVLQPLPESDRLWHPAPAGSFIPPPSTLVAGLEADSRAHSVRRGLRERYRALEPKIKELCSSYILSAFRRLGWPLAPGDVHSPNALAAMMKIEPKYRRLIDTYLETLEAGGFLRKITSNGEHSWEATGRGEALPEQEKAWRELLFAFPAYYPELTLLRTCGDQLDQVLCGAVEPLQLLFGTTSAPSMELLYTDSHSMDSTNRTVMKAVAEIVSRLPEGRRLDILEVGAGTGGTAASILPVLPPGRARYVFTDLSPTFLSKAEDRFHGYSCVEYRLFDLEKNPREQKFAEGERFDVIVATDVLHATADLRQTLSHLRTLLAEGALLILGELVGRPPQVDLGFALTEGWWRFNDDLRKDSPLLDRDQWVRLLRDEGLEDVATVSENAGPEEPGHVVLLARGGDRAEGDSPPAPFTLSEPAAKEGWLLFADRGGVADRLAAALREGGHRPVMVVPGPEYRCLDTDVYQVSPSGSDDMRRIMKEAFADPGSTCRGLVYGWGLDIPPPGQLTVVGLERSQEETVFSVVHMVQSLVTDCALRPPPPLTLLTRGAQPAGERIEGLSLSQAPMNGLGRVIANELPDLRCRMIDLDPREREAPLSSLLSELLLSDSAEDQVALRGEARYVLRLRRGILPPLPGPAGRAEERGRPSVRLETERPGVLDALRLVSVDRRKPGPDEILVEVSAAGLNFRDVMKGLGIYPDDVLDLGDECSGIVAAAGREVSDFRPGDRVAVLGPGMFSTWITVPAKLAMRLPDWFTMEEGAGILVNYLTAYHALCQTAGMSRDERVLIHSAAGGVGLAAVQIARSRGAEVFATAGTAEKRELLSRLGVRHVMNSRDLSFGDEIREMTSGEGVDIVLNSLAGQAIPMGLSLLREHGRFLELGKRDIYSDSRIGLRPFRKSLSFHAIDISRPLRRGDIRSVLEELHSLFEKRVLSPVPYRSFPLTAAAAAFRTMSQGKHLGKLILSMDVDLPPAPPKTDRSRFACRSDAAYLVVGGLRGFGLATAEWLARRGARHLVLTGRSGIACDEGLEGVARLREKGVEVLVAASDVSRREDLESLLSQIASSMPPLRGVIHSAMVLKDSMLRDADRSGLRDVMTPKVSGAWNLHLQTLDLPLDFFVCFSSLSSLIGNPGQAGYAAANSFLEALARYRRLQGLPGLAIAWDRLEEVGYVARNEKLGDHLTRMGWSGLTTEEALRAMEGLIVNDATHVVVTAVDWDKLALKMPSVSTLPRYEELVGEKAGPERGQGQQIRMEILKAPDEERPRILEEYFRSQIAAILMVSPSRIDPDTPLDQLGLDSLGAVELMASIDSQLGISLPGEGLMKGPTVRKLTRGALPLITGQPGDGEKEGAAASPEPVAAEGRRGGEFHSFAEDESLGRSIPTAVPRSRSVRAGAGEKVLLTGPTSFLGAHILSELLRQTDAKILCLLRSPDEAGAWVKVLNALAGRDLSIDEDRARARMEIICGDLSKPSLGLTEDQFRSLGERLDCIYHNGAVVNHLAGYLTMRDVNVLGSYEILKLAATGGATPVHLTSSIAVHGLPEGGNGEKVREGAPATSVEQLAAGYGQSRWISEKIFTGGREIGVPANIYRPGIIIGNSRTGIMSAEDTIWRIVRTSIEFGVGPLSKVELYLTPVDYVSGAIVYLSRHRDNMGKIYHLVSPGGATLLDILEYAVSIGYPIKFVPPGEWEGQIAARADGDHPLRSILSLSSQSLKRGIADFPASPALGTDNADGDLAGSGIVSNGVSEEFLSRCFDYLVGEGFLKRPGSIPPDRAVPG